MADAIPDREALVCDQRRLTFADLDERATRLAHHLATRGIGAGDHVGLYLYNGTEYLEAMLAAFKLRAVPVNVNYRYGADELRYLLVDADARAIVYHGALESRLAPLAAEIPELETFVRVDDGTPRSPAQPPGALDYEHALSLADPTRDFGPRSCDDLYVLYTGGTTGMPKGVMWRHEDVFFGALGGGGGGGAPISTPDELADRARDGRRRRCLPACPFMHGTAHWMALGALLTGGTVVVSPDRKLDPIRLWRLVARERVQLLVIVGDAFARPLVEALEQPELAGVDLSRCSVILSGGAILSPAVKTMLAEQLPGSVVVDGYGASETGGQGQSVTVAGAEPSPTPRFTVNDQTTVLDDELAPAAVGVVGRLARRGHIPLGYYKDPEKTAATFPVVDGVRWSVPGDHARIEADGTITLLGRGSVSINTGGEKVYPEEVEAALKAHPAVFDAIVVGVPDDRWGERVVAVVQPRPGAAPDAADLGAHVRARLADYKAPRDVVLVDTVERSPSGKPDYRWARATALDHR